MLALVLCATSSYGSPLRVNWSLNFWLVGNSYLGIISGLSVAQNQVMEAMLKPGLVN